MNRVDEILCCTEAVEFDVILPSLFAFVAFGFGNRSKPNHCQVDVKELTASVFFWKFYSFPFLVTPGLH